jgi:hypothetical protein
MSASGSRCGNSASIQGVTAVTLGSNYSAISVSFGDTGTLAAQVSLAPSTDSNPCDIDAIGHHVYTGPGTYSTSVTVRDEDGNTVTVAGSSNVDVNDAALTLVRGEHRGDDTGKWQPRFRHHLRRLPRPRSVLRWRR